MGSFFIITSLLKIVGILAVILPMVSYAVYAERRVSAFMQDRLGPNRVGPAGLLQPIADAAKFLLKEDFTPASVDTFYYWLAPCLAMIPAILTIAVVPFGSTLFGVPMVIADINVGILYVFAIASLGVYGIVLGGWASNSKYPFLVGIFAETNRLPFDLPEAEQELAGGYHTEYSSMKFALFFLGEYAAMISGSAIVVTLFLGGWHFPGIPDGLHGWIFGLINIAIFFAKVAALIFFMLWVRWTLPRFRWDQLMRLGWLFFFEIALVNIFIVAA